LTRKGFCVGAGELVVVVVSSVVVVDVVLEVEVVVVESRGPTVEKAALPASERRNPAAMGTTMIRRNFKKTPVLID
jgi:hypothetical protein